ESPSRKNRIDSAGDFAGFTIWGGESGPNLTVFGEPLQFAKHERIHAPNLGSRREPRHTRGFPPHPRRFTPARPSSASQSHAPDDPVSPAPPKHRGFLEVRPRQRLFEFDPRIEKPTSFHRPQADLPAPKRNWP